MKVRKNLFVKKPFYTVLPQVELPSVPQSLDNLQCDASPFPNIVQVIPQSQFLAEFYTTGHRINSPDYYPDLWTKDNDGKYVCERVPRCSFPLQYVITTQQLIHLCGNPIHFSDGNSAFQITNDDNLVMIKQGWMDKNMEVAWYEAAQSEKITGDAATCLSFVDGKLHWQTFSFLNGDSIYPHYNSLTQELELFVRKYSKLNEQGDEALSCVDIWDKKMMYHFEMDREGLAGIVNDALELFGLSGYKLIYQAPHGFTRIPIVYKRSNVGACWTPVQPLIDTYELSCSQLCASNKNYAFPILFMAGDGASIKGRSDGRPYAIISNDSSAKANILSNGDSAESFKLQLDILLKNIFLGSFTVTPPEVRSGDLPGVAIKLIYSPSLEKAMADANEWNLYIDNLVELFVEGYGMEIGKSSDFNTMKVSGEIEPYVHQNTAEKIRLLCEEVNAGILSKRTAAAENPDAVNDEYRRVMNEMRDEIVGI